MKTVATVEALLRRARKSKARPVDLFFQASDHECALLGAMGFSTQFIMERTQLSHGQVTYRLSKAGLTHENNASRTDFRNGKSTFSAVLLNSLTDRVDRDLKTFLRHNLAT